MGGIWFWWWVVIRGGRQAVVGWMVGEGVALLGREDRSGSWCQDW